jgi:cytoskeletal protein RodZ
MFALIAGAVIVVAVAVVALTSLGGSSTDNNASTPSTTTSVSQTSAHHTSTHSRARSKPAPKAQAVSPAETSVAVLNGTETTGLAHHISADLQQSGYSQAQPLNGRPPGSGQVTVVQYASGHQAEAEGVAHSLEVSRVQPLEAAVASLAGSANVVVIVGADKAATVP